RLYLGEGGAGGKPGAVKCSECHGLSGRGDGPNTEVFGKITGSQPEQTYDHPGLHDDWGNVIQPRNLTRGVYRFGRKPIDLYRRINQGINGTPMPKADLSDQELWDLVNFVMSLPFDGKHSAAPDDAHGEAAGNKVAADQAGD
ncbi:MAG: c-type cytochrome, partial [Planctomycetaceae bacterium]